MGGKRNDKERVVLEAEGLDYDDLCMMDEYERNEVHKDAWCR